MHIRAVVGAALLLVPSVVAAPRGPAVLEAVGGDAPYRLVLALAQPTPAAGGTATVTLTVARPPTAASGAAQGAVDPTSALAAGEEAIGVALTSSGGATIAVDSLAGCAEVAETCRLHGEVGVTSTVSFSVDVPAGSTAAAVQATIAEHRDQDGAEFDVASDAAASESAELAVGPGFPVTYSPEVVRPGDVVRVRVSGLPSDGDWRLSWSQGVAPVGPFRSVDGVIDASFPILQFDPLGPRTLLVTDASDAAAQALPTTARVPLLVVPPEGA